MSRTLNGIVAVCPDMGIGRKGHLPWHPKKLRKELKYFQKMTMTTTVQGRENVVIMGRKTWFSIPESNRPLPDRINIVLSRNLRYPPAGAHYSASDFGSALHLLDTSELAGKVDQVWIIGGSCLYKELMESSHHQRLFVTRVLQQFHCDMFMPTISLDKYQLLPDRHFSPKRRTSHRKYNVFITLAERYSCRRVILKCSSFVSFCHEPIFITLS
uniref:dihydrofolate reductase n=2 Tax=Scleropages formosus TaxID=113540 RepID=A0A8C9WDR2_SCLFO